MTWHNHAPLFCNWIQNYWQSLWQKVHGVTYNSKLKRTSLPQSVQLESAAHSTFNDNCLVYKLTPFAATMAILTKSARDNFAVCVLMLILASASALMRILSRLTHHHTLLAADWMCLVSLCFFAAYCALVINCMRGWAYLIEMILTSWAVIFNTSQFHAFDPNPAYGLTELVNLSKVRVAMCWLPYTVIIITIDLQEHLFTDSDGASRCHSLPKFSSELASLP